MKIREVKENDSLLTDSKSFSVTVFQLKHLTLINKFFFLAPQFNTKTTLTLVSKSLMC